MVLLIQLNFAASRLSQIEAFIPLQALRMQTPDNKTSKRNTKDCVCGLLRAPLFNLTVGGVSLRRRLGITQPKVPYSPQAAFQRSAQIHLYTISHCSGVISMEVWWSFRDRALIFKKSFYGELIVNSAMKMVIFFNTKGGNKGHE